MAYIRIFNGLHDGMEVMLPVGETSIGCGADNTLILLDEGIPDQLLRISRDGDGTLRLLWLSNGVELLDADENPVAASFPLSLDEYLQMTELSAAASDNVAAKPASSDIQERLEPQFPGASQACWRVIVAGVTLGIFVDFRQHRVAHAATFSSAHGTAADVQPESVHANVPRWIRRFPALARCCSRLAASPMFATQRRRYVAAASVAGCLLFAFFFVARSAVPSKPDQLSDRPVPLFESLKLSTQLSLGHQAPQHLQDDLLDDKHMQKDPYSEGVMQSAGRDAPDGQNMKMSTELTTGLTLRAGNPVAEQALAFLQERTSQSPWVSRLIFNTQGSRMTARGVLSETERADFERLVSLLVREFGQQVSFRFYIDPLELPLRLQVKQVVGGATPVAILEDGTRLTPGSYYEGRMVESITVDRIVLRGKDRIESPI